MMCSSVFLQASCLFLTLILTCACSSSGSGDMPGGQQPIEQFEDSSTTPAWTPVVTPGSDIERLLIALERQVENTLLTLNEKISSGEALTPTESVCAGNHDLSLGEPLYAIDCSAGAPLAAAVSSPTVRVSVPIASYFNTAACQASLYSLRTTECQLSSTRIVISSEWVVPPEPQLPYPVAGIQISYALDTTAPVLILESLSDTLSEPFYCETDLLLPDTESDDCASVARRAAERLDQLVL